jgi:hypothetical protein
MKTTHNTEILAAGSYAVDDIGTVSGEPIMEFAVTAVEAGVTYRVVGTFERNGLSLDASYRLARRHMATMREMLRTFGVFYTTIEYPRYAAFNLWAERVGA